MLKQRIMTAILLAPILLFIVMYGNHPLFAVLVLVLQSAATYEWLKINKLSMKLAIFNALIIGLFTLLMADNLYLLDQMQLFGSAQLSHKLMLICYIIIWVLALLWLKKHRWGHQNTGFQIAIKSVLGVLAIMLFAISMYQLYAVTDGKWWTLSLFFLIWVADIGAYVSGKTMGKHKLAINISPGKTWEGVLGAQILVAVYAIIITQFLELTWQQALLVFVPVALFSVVGDLAASLGKRQAGVKDSSQLLPGHGGFIDRFDSLIAAAPMYYFLLHNV